MTFHLKGLDLQSTEFSINTIPQHNEDRLLDRFRRVNADKENLLLLILAEQSLAVLVWVIHYD